MRQGELEQRERLSVDGIDGYEFAGCGLEVEIGDQHVDVVNENRGGMICG